MTAPKSSGGVFDVPALTVRQNQLVEQSAKPDFSDRQETAQAALKEQEQIRAQLTGYKMLRDKLDEARVFLQMAEEDGRDESEAARETQAALDVSPAVLDRHELRLM